MRLKYDVLGSEPPQKTLYFKFIDGGPYFAEDFRDLVNSSTGQQKIRMYFKYNNADNPHTILTLKPSSVFSGLYQIGGIITIVGLLNVLLYKYNTKSIEGKLQTEWSKKLSDRIARDRTRLEEGGD